MIKYLGIVQMVDFKGDFFLMNISVGFSEIFLLGTSIWNFCDGFFSGLFYSSLCFWHHSGIIQHNALYGSPIIPPSDSWTKSLWRGFPWALYKVLVIQLCRTLCEPMDCSSLGSSVHGILQARVLEWVVIPFSRGSSWSRDQNLVSCIALYRVPCILTCVHHEQLLPTRHLFFHRDTGLSRPKLLS